RALRVVSIRIKADELEELRTKAQALDAKVEELHRANEDLKSFAYVASHDLQEPLRMVGNFTALMFESMDMVIQRATETCAQVGGAGHKDTEQRRADTELMEALAQINSSRRYVEAGVKRMSQLIDDLLAFSRAGRVLSVTATSLGTLIESIQHGLHVPIAEKGAVIQVADPTAELWVDRGAARSLFQNLLSNALKFARDDTAPQIVISAQRDAEWTYVRVVDNGIGIEARFIDRVFDPFFRLHSREKYGGTGIGLALCRKIALAHGGVISVESAGKGRGTTFTVRFPTKEQVFREVLYK
ncbi:MAG: sensor histidine kinase, partial [Mycobacterium sp.]